MRLILSLMAAAGLLSGALPALAQADAYPSRAVRLVVPFAAGGTTDIIARVVSDKMGAALTQQIAAEYEIYRKTVERQNLKPD